RRGGPGTATRRQGGAGRVRPGRARATGRGTKPRAQSLRTRRRRHSHVRGHSHLVHSMDAWQFTELYGDAGAAWRLRYFKPEFDRHSSVPQNDPNAEPRAMTTTSAMSAPTIPTITISR